MTMKPALADILGVDSKTLLMMEDKETNKAAMDAFVSKYQKMNRWVDMTDGSRVLYVGADNFAFPVPLAENSSGRWYFDGVAGSQEIRTRDIGRNELLAIDACAAIANGQDVYLRPLWLVARIRAAHHQHSRQTGRPVLACVG